MFIKIQAYKEINQIFQKDKKQYLHRNNLVHRKINIRSKGYYQQHLIIKYLFQEEAIPTTTD